MCSQQKSVELLALTAVHFRLDEFRGDDSLAYQAAGRRFVWLPEVIYA